MLNDKRSSNRSITRVARVANIIEQEGPKHINQVTSGEKCDLVRAWCFINAIRNYSHPYFQELIGVPPEAAGDIPQSNWVNSEVFISIE